MDVLRVSVILQVKPDELKADKLPGLMRNYQSRFMVSKIPDVGFVSENTHRSVRQLKK